MFAKGVGGANETRPDGDAWRTPKDKGMRNDRDGAREAAREALQRSTGRSSLWCSDSYSLCPSTLLLAAIPEPIISRHG